MSRFWTPERVRELAHLAAGGKSASQIASVLGCSRQAVIGKLWRGEGRFGKLAREPGGKGRTPRPPRAETVRVRPQVRKAPTGTRRAGPAATEARAASVARPVSPPPAAPCAPMAFLAAVEASRCLWFAGEAYGPNGPDMPVCGAPRADMPGTRYCARHADMVRRREPA